MLPPAFLVLGVTARYIKTKSVPTAAFVPIVVIPYLMAYQADLAYGNKADRIYNEANRILVRSLAATSPARILRAHRSVCAFLGGGRTAGGGGALVHASQARGEQKEGHDPVVLDDLNVFLSTNRTIKYKFHREREEWYTKARGRHFSMQL